MTQSELTKQINQNFRIKIYGKNDKGESLNTLLGVSGLIRIVSLSKAIKYMTRALKSDQDKIRIKIYNSYTITFYQK